MITKLRCILLDDEVPGLTYLKMLCEQIPEVEIVKVFNDPRKLLDEVDRLQFDVCILDIEMPGVNGLQIAQALKHKQFIFATAYRQHAADAFDLDATDFVSKPVTKERLEVAIRKALAKKRLQEEGEHRLLLNTDKGKTFIDVSHIAYITTSEIDSRDKIAVMADGTKVVLKNIAFEALQSYLPQDLFFRVNKKQVVALKIVASFTHNLITTSLTGDGVPVTMLLSEAFRQSFQQAAKRLL